MNGLFPDKASSQVCQDLPAKSANLQVFPDISDTGFSQ